MVVNLAEDRLDGGSRDDLSVLAPNRQMVDRANRLRKAVQEGGGKKAVSERAGIPQSTLGHYLNPHEGARLTVLDQIAAACGVNPVWLAFGDGAAAPSSGEMVVSDDRYVSIAHYDVQASAGLGALVNNEQVVEYIRFDKEWIRTSLKRPANKIVLIEARGDSMEPTIRHGDVLLVDISSQEISSSAIHVIAVENDLLVKRIEHRLGGSILIYSDNPRYPSQEITKENRADLRIVGQVVWQGGLPR